MHVGLLQLTHLGYWEVEFTRQKSVLHAATSPQVFYYSRALCRAYDTIRLVCLIVRIAHSSQPAWLLRPCWDSHSLLEFLVIMKIKDCRQMKCVTLRYFPHDSQ